MAEWPRVSTILREMGLYNGSPEDLILALAKIAARPDLSDEEIATIRLAIQKLKGSDVPFYYEPKHRRRGRYVDHWCNEIASGRSVPTEWWAGKSGEPSKNDEVEHESTRPFIEAYQAFLRETGFKMEHCALEVRNSIHRYVGHIDQLGRFARPALLDLKTGGESDWHRLQLGLYKPAVAETLRAAKLAHGPYLADRYNLYLTNDGKYRLVKRDNPRDITEACILAQAWHVINAMKGAV